MDRERLAAALAYEQEKRRRLAESVPGLVTTPAQPAPQSDFRTNLENLSIGLGRGVTTGLEGVKGIITDPVGTARGVYESGKAVIRDPSVIADALRYTAEKATSGPLGAGEVIGEMLGPRKGGPVMQELDVYHGTPHKFPATEANPLGEFDASKIGTGEGAQAYGHGVYLAEAPEVAEGYKKTISQSMTAGAQRRLQNAGGDLDKAIADTEARAAKYRQGGAKSYAEAAEEDLRGLRQFKEAGEWTSGSLYKADLPDEMIDRMLDWDKPLSEQRELATPILKELGYLRPTDDGPRQFSQAVKALALEHGGFGESGATGMALFNAIYKGLQQGKPKAINLAKRMNLNEQEMFMEASPLASEVMKRMGIPGIRYLDAGSRGQGGSGTRNFVVFPGEEKKVRILERK